MSGSAGNAKGQEHLSESAPQSTSINKILDDKEERLKAETKAKFLTAYHDPVAQINTFSSCMTLADLSRDGNFKLILADFGKMDSTQLSTGSNAANIKLKVYEGTNLRMEKTILDFPTGIAAIYIDNHVPKTPAIILASGQSVFVYKNMTPLYKHTLKTLPVCQREQEYWDLARDGHVSASVLRDRLESMRLNPEESQSNLPLTTKSQKLIMMTNPEAMANFVNTHKVSPLTRQNVITCLSSLKKNQTDDDAISCIVLGTENRDLIILDTEAFNVLSQFSVPGVPVSVDAAGEHDVNYRITILTRDAKLYVAKKPQSWETPQVKLLTELSSQAVGLVRTGKFFMIACMDQTLNCYTPKGKKAWSITMPGAILATELMDQKARGFQAVLVSLDNRQIRMYKEKFLVGILDTGEHNVVAMSFGQFGREESALITINGNGALTVRLLRRVAKFSEKEMFAGAPPEQNMRLNIPKKTKLYVDQTVREREHAADIYRAFQQDLMKLRLTVAQNYKRALDKSLTPMAQNESTPIKMSAQVQGIGPLFKLIIGIQNTSPSKPLIELYVIFRCDQTLYDVKQKLIQPGMLVPGLDYKFETFVQCLSQQPLSGDIEIIVGKKNEWNPVVVNVIQMPISEGSFF